MTTIPALDLAFVPRFLDGCVDRAHRLRVFGHRYHPYHLCTDAGTVAVFVLGAFHAGRTPEARLGPLLAVFAGFLVGYPLFLRGKRALAGAASRSYLQDTVLFVLPYFAVASRAASIPLATMSDLLGLIFPLYLAFTRIGCFLGGCCYGLPSPHGVRYRPEHRRSVAGCRRFAPGEPVAERVFPLQLVEAAFHAAAFAVLSYRGRHASAGLALPIYLLAYAAFRFAADFYRRASARPRRGPFSEAQVVCIGLAAVCGAIVCLLSS